MINPKSIFQRSEKGRAAILQNRRGLAHAERKVLVLVDGVADLTSMHANVASLEQLQFERALQTLIDASMVVEVLLASANASPDHIAPDVAMRFVDQDALDPAPGTSADSGPDVNSSRPVACGYGGTPALSAAKEGSRFVSPDNGGGEMPANHRVPTHPQSAMLSVNTSTPKADSGLDRAALENYENPVSCSQARESKFRGGVRWFFSPAPWVLIAAGTIASALAIFCWSTLMH